MNLTPAQADRAAGVLLGQACGDALGVPYEFGPLLGEYEPAVMSGGGLGNGAPGEWSDDTAMAAAVAEVAATGADLTTEAALDAITDRFLAWYNAGPPDIGHQTSAVLGKTARRLQAGEFGSARIAFEESAAYVARSPRAAGNGALMRTTPVALAHLDDRAKCAVAARKIARLTHGDDLAGDSCVLWSEAVRIAVLEGHIDITSGLDLIPTERRERWGQWIDEAQSSPATIFTPNGYTVTAFQAALAAITTTPIPDHAPAGGAFECLHLQDALHAAVRIGDDTDTVAAIAGGLLGARWGASAIPWQWRRIVHGWPGLNSRDLISLAALTVQGGVPDDKGWPTVADVAYSESVSADVIAHPNDARVLLGNHASREHGATAVIAACRVGRAQACHDGAEVVIESRILDSENPDENQNLHFALFDAADAIRGLRAEGHTVFVHCAAAQQRTPSIAAAYCILLGQSGPVAQRQIQQALPSTRGSGQLWDAVLDLA